MFNGIAAPHSSAAMVVLSYCIAVLKAVAAQSSVQCDAAALDEW